MSELGCAQDSNGNLLSPSKIKWFNDADDEDPIPPPAPPAPSSSKPTTLDRYFPSGPSIPIAADKIAGSRRSARKTYPSKRVVDPNNTEVPSLQAAVASSSKRKASGMGKDATYKVSRQRRIIEDSDGDGNTEVEDDGTHDNSGSFIDSMEKANTGSSDEGSDVEANYAATKALADNDHEVSHFHVPQGTDTEIPGTYSIA
jgi:hypothetical protein